MTVGTIATVPGARPVVELGVGDTRVNSGQAVWSVARWDTPGDMWSGVDPTWLDITCDVHDIELDQGRDRTISRWQVGTASITLDNTAGVYDVNAPPASPAVLSVRPGRQLRVGMALDGADPQWLWRGFIDAANPTYDPVLHDVVELSCVDAKGQAGKVDLGTVADPGVGASETVTARINRVLDAAAWYSHRDIAAGSTTLQATTLGAKVVDLIDVAADSAGGAVFGDGRGMVVYRGRDWQTYEPDVPVDDTIGNLPPVPGDDIVWTAPATPAPPTDVLVEPFNDYTTNGWGLTNAPTIVAGRTGTAARLTVNRTGTWTIPALNESDWLTWGFAFQISDLTLTRRIASLRSDAAVTVHNTFQITDAGQVDVRRGTGAGAQIAVSAAGVVAINTWVYLEFQVRLHDTLGEVRVRVNGVEVINLVPADTKNGGTKAVFDAIVIDAATTQLYDDMYLAAGAAATFHGPITIPPGPPTPPTGGGETVAVTFSGDQLVWQAGIAADAVCPSGWEMSFEAADMATRVLVGRSSEPPHQFDDTDAQILYGIETFTRTDLICANPGDVDVLGARYLTVLSADFMPNIAAVTIDAATSVEARNLAATVDPTLPSRYRGYLREGTRVVFDRQFFAVGVAHRIDPEGWTVRIALDDAGPFAVTGDRWDGAAWGTGTWAAPPVELDGLVAEARELIGAING